MDVTTFNGDIFDEWKHILDELHISQPRAVKYGRYTGLMWNDVVFLGSGFQKKQPHFMLHVTGVDADRIFREISLRDSWEVSRVNCTRIDIQVTFWGDVNRMELSEFAQEEKKEHPYEKKNKRKYVINAYVGDENDTLYIGAPSSTKRLRIYDKPLADDYTNTHYMERTELQFRKQTAHGVFLKLEATEDRHKSAWIESAIRGEVGKMPDHWREQLSGWIGTQERDATPIPRGKKTPVVSNRTAWVATNRNALAIACKQEGHDGARCREMLFRAIVEALIDTRWETYHDWKIIRTIDTLDAVEFYYYHMVKQGEEVTDTPTR